MGSSHLFQRVASFLLYKEELDFLVKFMLVLISFREWLHSYRVISAIDGRTKEQVLISFREWLHSYSLAESTEGLYFLFVLISFREWLHSYIGIKV